MPNFSGIWNATEQFQARAQNIWPAPPGAPTIGTATQASLTSVSVPFTAPACTGRFPAGISSYTAVSTPGCLTASGASSPLVVTGLTTGTAYTFRVRATGSNGTGPFSAASNSVTPQITCATFTTAGTFTWVAPTGITSVSVVAVGGGGGGLLGNLRGGGGSGGGLGYRNNQAVTPGNSYTVIVGAGGLGGATPTDGGCSSFCSTAVVRGGRGLKGIVGGCGTASTAGGTFTGTGGGNGGVASNNSPCFSNRGAGGAGGYSGAGGLGDPTSSGTSGAGGGGGGGAGTFCFTGPGFGSGGGVGIFGQGTNGAGGGVNAGGRGGSGGTDGGGNGGLYGGGGRGGNNFCSPSGNGGRGAVRIVWPGNTRSFPSTNVGA